MRPAGVVESAVGLGPGSHVGWAYADRAELRTRAWEYLSDGIAAGQRIEFLGSGSVEALRAELAGLAGAVPFARRRRQFNQDGIGVALVDDVYVFSGPDRVVVNPVQSVAARVAATEDALAAGYTGLRAVVDATTLAGTSAQRAAYAHYEYLLDQESSTLPLGTICAYDTATLGSAAVAEMACLHPFASRGASTFRLYAHDGAAFALAGEVDCSSVGRFADTLGRILPLVLPLVLPVVPGPELVVDGRELEFIDHRGLLVLDSCAGKLGLRLAMQTHRQTAAHIAEALGLQHLRVDVLA